MKIRPSPASRSAILSCTFSPRARSSSLALASSPPASVRAFLQSIIGSPVSSRSFLTIWAVICISVLLPESDPRGATDPSLAALFWHTRPAARAAGTA